MDEQQAALAIGAGSFNEFEYRLSGLTDCHAMQVEFAPNLELPRFQALENAILKARRFPGQNRIGFDGIYDNRSRPLAAVLLVPQAFRGVAFCP